MYKKLFSSATFLVFLVAALGQLIIYYGTSQGEFFGLNQQSLWTKIFLFNPKNPMSFGGLTFITSFIYHQSGWHFLGNILAFFMISLSLEKKLKAQTTILLMGTIHLFTLLTILIIDKLQGHTIIFVFSGLSVIVLGLLGAYLYFFKKKILMGLFLLLLIFYAFNGQQPSQIIDPHLIAGIIGILNMAVIKKLKASRNGGVFS